MSLRQEPKNRRLKQETATGAYNQEPKDRNLQSETCNQEETKKGNTT